MHDPYSILGVSKGASDNEIKSTFRKLAKQYHPDQNADDPKAQAKFSEINSAYEILGDKEKRGQFDRGEIDNEGKPRGFASGGDPFGAGGPFGGGFKQTNQTSGGFSAEDILSEIFGGQAGHPGRGDPFSDIRQKQSRPQTSSYGSQRGEDIKTTLNVNLEQLAQKEKVRINLPTGKSLSVSLPDGVEEGQVIRLKGQGQKGFRGASGDALITIHIQKHPLFKKEGDVLRLDLPITLYEAVLGAKVKVPTLSGSVSLSVPKGANGGQTLRLKERGIFKKDGQHGDILVTLRIILPEGGSADLETMMQVWKEQRPYNVRGKGFE